MTTTLDLPLVADLRAPTAKDDRPGCGCMLVMKAERRLALPLRSVSFQAAVIERVAEVTVEQTFANPHAELLEAVYIFPLPGGAAVSRFELHVGGKQLVGLVEERGEARRQYAEAVSQGKKAALLEQERDDVFTVKVGNLPPKEQATVKLVYSERLPAYADGETELRIPLLVAPRYIPGFELERASTGEGTSSDTTQVPDASRITPPRLAPGLRGEVALSIGVTLLGEDEVADLGCTQHATRVGMGSGKLTVSLAKKDELLDRDFVLRWRTASVHEKPILLVARKGEECFGLLSLVPPRSATAGEGARDVLFLLDRSGSMGGDRMAPGGAKMTSAKKALEALLGTLQPQDRFLVCAFDDQQEWSAGDFTQVSTATLGAARNWLARVEARGGTELEPALSAALGAFDKSRADADVVPAGARVKPGAPRTGGQRIPILVLVTDGQVGNESEILRRIEGRLSGLRVFTLGIDTAVNASFLRRLAHLGRGTATLCEPGPGLEDALARIGKEIGTPVLLDVEVEDRGLGLDTASLTPERLPDLFAGRTASVFFKCRVSAGGVRVKARRASGEAWEQTVEAESVPLTAISQLWAKQRVADLEDRFRLAMGGVGGGLEAAKAEILELALTHQLLTRFTAFIVVDHDEAAKRLALPRRTVVQAVEQPAGWADKDEDAAPAGMGASSLSLASPAPMTASPSVVRPAPGPTTRFSTTAPMMGGGGAARLGPPPAGAVARSPAAPLQQPSMSSGRGPAVDERLLSDSAEMDGEMRMRVGGGTTRGAEKKSLIGPPRGKDVADAGDLAARLTRTGPVVDLPCPDERVLPAGASALSRASVLQERIQRRLGAPEAPSLLGKVARTLGLGGKGGAFDARRALTVLLELLSKQLALLQAELEAGRWPQDDALELSRLRVEAAFALVSSGLADRTPRVRELLERTLTDLVESVRHRRGQLKAHAGSARTAAEALAARGRAELAPLLGQGGTPWEASV